MRSFMLAIGTMMLSGALAAQAPLPGTFSSTPPQTTQQTNGSGNSGGYIVSPPTISYGDGVTPTVVTNQDAVQVTAPQNSAITGATVQANNPATLSNNANANPANATQPQHFDFVVAPNGNNSVVGGSIEDDTVSLGDVARKYRSGKTIAKRTLTNADVDALNAQYPGANPNPEAQNNAANSNGMAGTAISGPSARPNGPFSAPPNAQNSGGTAGAAQSGAESSSMYAQPIGTPARTTTGGPKPSARQGASETTEPNNSAPTTEEQVPPQTNNNSQPQQEEQKQQLPRSSSALPLLGTLGALSTLAGILYFKMR